MHVSIWSDTQRIGRTVNANRVDALIREYPKLAAAGEALDFIAQALTELPNKTIEEANRRHMAAWTAEKLRAAILILLVNGAPNAAVLAERALTGIELQLVFKTKPHVERTFIARDQVDNAERTEVRKSCWWLSQLGWLHGTIWPKALRRGIPTTSDLALTAEGDEPARPSELINAIARITEEQLDLIRQSSKGAFENPTTKARYQGIRTELARPTSPSEELGEARVIA
jgi:hypothetical protein